MKLTKAKLFAFILAILMIVSSLPLVANAAPTSYSKTSNSGTRNEVCVSLSGTSVATYYTGDYEYADFVEMSQIELKSALSTLMRSTHTKITSYKDCKTYAFQTDCERNDTSYALSLYLSEHITSAQWEPMQAYNREHVWPQSLGGKSTSGGGADLHHIRPCNSSTNSSRSNEPYGTKNNNYYTPADNVKGDVARIILYVYVRWGSDWGATDVTKVFESVDMLLEWCALDPVDTWEMGRNEVVQKIQGNRNVFIDYPELAWQLFGKSAPSTMTTPSGAAANGNVPEIPSGGATDGGSTGSGSTTPDTPAEIPDSFVLNNKGSYVTATSKTYTSTTSNTTKDQLEMSTSKSDAATFTLVNNSDGTVSLKTGNKFLYADGTHVRLVDSGNDNTKYYLESTSGGYFVKCANAVYNSKPQYLEVYKESLTCYGMGDDATIYVFVFESVSGSTGGGNTGSGSTGGSTGGNEGSGSTGGNTGSGSTTSGALATFDFGANGSATHKDGSAAAEGVSFTSGSYTITLTGVSKLYSGAIDATGNSCLKLGTGDSVGSFSFTVGSDVKKVIIHVAQYKKNKTVITINGTEHTINTLSNDGDYTAITVDTSSTKTVTVATTTSGKRCMINTIELFGTSSSGGNTGSGSTGGNTGSGSTDSGNSGNGSTTPSTPSTPTTPSGIPDSFVIKNQDKYVSGTVYAYTSSSGSTKDELEMTESKSAAAVFKLIKNSDGTVSFKMGSKFLFADGTNVRFSDTENENTKFVLEETAGGYFIKCASATYQDKAQYLEVWSGYLTCYSMGSDTAIYTFSFEAVSSGNSGSGSTEGGTTTPEGGNNGNEGGNTTPEGGNNGNDGGNTDNEGGNTTPEGGNNGSEGGNATPEGGNNGNEGGNNDSESGNTTPEGGNDDSEGGNTENGEEGGHTELDAIPEIPWPEDDKSDNTTTTVIIIIAVCAAGALAAVAVVIIKKKK